MICFQFQFFLSLIPTLYSRNKSCMLLWFAFNFSSFYLWYQLLRKVCIEETVVICFQFQFFLSLIPTIPCTRLHVTVLWFAFNFSSFYLWYQRSMVELVNHEGCDLLSISVLSIFDTNSAILAYINSDVVICFQFQFFLSLIPTISYQNGAYSGLWFAFNFSSFYLWYQHKWYELGGFYCCDLLSISVLSIFDTNTFSWKPY